MATPSKIDIHQLDQLLKENKSTSDIAKHFGCTPGAVSQAKRKLNVAMAQSAVTREAPALLEKKKTAMDRLMELADQCEDQLNWIEKNITPASDGEYREWQSQIVKFTAEIRKLISSMADIRVKIYRAETVERALLIMYEEIRSESPECQKRIRDRLRKASVYLPLDD